MSDHKLTDFRLLKKRSATPSELVPPPEVIPTPALESTLPTQSAIGFERIETEAPLTKSLGNSGWEVAQLLKEWRLDENG